MSQEEEGGIDLGGVEQNLEGDSKHMETMPMKSCADTKQI